MSKAEDKAKEFLKKLVSHATLYEGTIDELEVYEPDDVIWAYKEGYHQAEKDLGLGWEDIRIILDAENNILHECNDNSQLVIETYPKGEDYYSEILKRFKESRKK